MNYLFCDNGIVGHVKKGGRGIIASAYCLVNPDCNILKENCEIEKDVTNNYGELKAIRNGIIESLKLNIKDIKIYSDSEIAVKCLNGEYSVNSEVIKPIYLEVKELIKKFESCEINWIKRDFNMYADYLTAVALDTFRKNKKEIIDKDVCLKQIAKIFHVGQSAISNRIQRNPLLKKSLSDKINISSVNEILDGKKHEEVANIYQLSRSRITQIWNDWLNQIREQYETGTSKEEIVKEQQENKINLTLEKLNEFNEELKQVNEIVKKELENKNMVVEFKPEIPKPAKNDYGNFGLMNKGNKKFTKIYYDIETDYKQEPGLIGVYNKDLKRIVLAQIVKEIRLKECEQKLNPRFEHRERRGYTYCVVTLETGIKIEMFIKYLYVLITMTKIKNYTLSLDSEVVAEARKKLQIGQALSPILNDLLKQWINKKAKEDEKK